MKILFIILLFVYCDETIAKETLRWHEGSIVLRNKKVVTGVIAIYQVQDMILFKSGKELSVFPASKIESVFFYDSLANINRKFISIQQKLNAFTFHQLFEIVLMGEISILRRIASTFSDYRDDKDGYCYFVQVEQELFEFYKFRRKIYPHLQKASPGLIGEMRENHWNPNHPADVVRIVDYYNRCLLARSTSARH